MYSHCVKKKIELHQAEYIKTFQTKASCSSSPFHGNCDSFILYMGNLIVALCLIMVRVGRAAGVNNTW